MRKKDMLDQQFLAALREVADEDQEQELDGRRALFAGSKGSKTVYLRAQEAIWEGEYPSEAYPGAVSEAVQLASLMLSIRRLKKQGYLYDGPRKNTFWVIMDD